MKKIFAILFAALAFFLFIACSSDTSDDDNDNSNSSSNSAPSSNSSLLPASIGVNELAWKYYDTYAGSRISFSNNTAHINGSGGNGQGSYNYTYNSVDKLLYLQLYHRNDSVNNVWYEWSSVNEYKTILLSELGDSLTTDTLECSIAEETARFNTIIVYKYTIAEDNLTLDLTEYFDGTLPTTANFGYSQKDDAYSYYDRLIMTGSGASNGGDLRVSGTGGFYLRRHDNNGYHAYYIYPVFSKNGFTGKMYSYDNSSETFTALGTASGSYTSSGTGTENCSITINFSELPSTLTSFPTYIFYTNTDYVLTNSVNSTHYYKKN